MYAAHFNLTRFKLNTLKLFLFTDFETKIEKITMLEIYKTKYQKTIWYVLLSGLQTVFRGLQRQCGVAVHTKGQNMILNEYLVALLTCTQNNYQ